MWIQDVWTSGIDWDLPGNGGPNCAKFSSPQRQVLEFIAGTTLALISLLVGISLHSYPSPIHLPFTKVSTLKLKITYLLLVSMSVTYLAEAGYKIYTYQAIFIANPCHCLCLVQIFILYRWYNQQVNNGNSKEPDLMLIYTFRIHLFFLHGPLMAVVFPVTNTLFLPGEVATYWIEHVLLLGIPIWCLKCTDLTVPSKTKWLDYLGWGLMAYGIWGLFHFIFLQPLAILTYANLNSLLCPAITDPFYGKNYRSYGIVHQFFITLVFGCVSNFIGNEEKVMLD